MSEIIFDVISKGPKVSHVANEMEPAAMEKHGCENGGKIGGGVCEELFRGKRPVADKCLALALFEKKDGDVGDDKKIGDDWCRLTFACVRSDRKNHGDDLECDDGKIRAWWL